MPLIPTQQTLEQKDTLSLRLEREIHERLRQYAEFIQSPKDYVIGQALRRLFRKDKEFAAWLDRRGRTPAGTSTTPTDAIPRRGGEARVSAPGDSPSPARTPTTRGGQA